MFSRIAYENWATPVAIMAFALIVLAFVVILVRTLRMKETKRDHAAHLPLEDESGRKEAGGTEDGEDRTKDKDEQPRKNPPE